MSAKLSGEVWDLELPTPQLIVLLAMADHADHEGNNVYPSIGLIAWKTGYSDRQVKRIVKQLVIDKLLIVVSAPKGQTVKYKIDLKAGKKKQPRNVGQNVTGDAIVSPPPVTQLCPTPSDIAMSPEPSIKPSIEPKDSAPQADAVSPSKIVEFPPQKTTLPKQKRERPHDPLFDAVKQHVFGIEGDAEGGRIAKISNWLAGKYEGRGENRVGFISAPAKPDHVKMFVEDFKRAAKQDGKELTPPLDFVRFVENWRKWASAKSKPAATSPLWTPVVAPVDSAPPMSPEERKRMIEDARKQRQELLRKASATNLEEAV